MEFKNKVACITGASVGIGRATAILFAQHGADLILIDINGEKLDSVKRELEEYDVSVKTYVCDVSDEAAVYAALSDKKVDILVNNAALWRDRSTFCDVDTALWRKYLDINVMGVVYCTKAVINGMVGRGYGRIINVASVAGVYGNAGQINYSATKAAIIGMTKTVAKELGSRGITCNAVAPGFIKTPMTDKLTDEQKEASMKLISMKRFGEVDDIAGVVSFLASKDAAYVTGQVIEVSGGIMM